MDKPYGILAVESSACRFLCGSFLIRKDYIYGGIKAQYIYSTTTDRRCQLLEALS